MKHLLETTKIYDSSTLQDFILSLESRYNVKNADKDYHNLVNFSKNVSVPYHQWFIYREGFAGELIKELILMSGAKKGECIVDPFCGSGTTNVVASLSGYNTLGLDVNPMSAFISNAKVDHYTSDDLELALKYISKLGDINYFDYKESYDDIKRYFNDNNFKELVQIKSYIDSLQDSKAKNILLVAFYSIIIECSDRKRDGNGLKKRVSKIEDVKLFFSEKVKLIINDISSIKPQQKIYGYCGYNTAYNLHSEYKSKFGDSLAGAIIFSPPYANSFDYFESYKLELIFGGFSDGMSGLNKLRKSAVRSFIGCATQTESDKYVDMIATEIEKSIPTKELETGKKDARTRKVPNMIRGYFSDMQEVLHQCYLALGHKRKTYIVVDQSAYCGKIVPTDLLLAYLAEQEGFTVDAIIECRKARTSTQQLNKYPYLKNTLRESIVELSKK